MDYQLHYENLISKHGHTIRPANTTYYERHHILPKALGGDNSISNLVYLTGRCHLLAHWLLYKLTNEPKMAMAFFMMRNNKSGYAITKCEDRVMTRIMKKHGQLSKRIETPLGIFDSYLDAAIAHGIPGSTIQNWVKQKPDVFKDLGSERPRLARAEGEHGMSRRVRTPLGVFNFIGAASKAHGITNKTLARRCEQFPENYEYLDPPTQGRKMESVSPNAKKVQTPLGIFDSITLAAEAHGLSRDVMRSKIRSVCNSGYYTI
jgi:hypothetical protein